MTDFIWHGPHTGLSIPDEKGGVAWEGIAAPGRRLEGLSADHPRVVALVAQGLLRAAPAASALPAKSTARQTAAKTED